MANGTVSRYIKNVSKSFGYAAIDKFKEIAPAPVEFVETNATFFKEIRSTSRKLMSTNISRTAGSIKNSKVFSTADKAIQNVFADLKSGNFYNKEREMQAGESMFDDDDFNMDNNWDKLDDESKYLGGMMDEVGQKSTRAVVSTVAQTANAITQNIRASTTLAHSQSIRMYGLVQRGMESIADNTGALVEFANTVGRAHAENSQKFYEASTALQNKQVELLEKIYNEIHVDDKKKNTRYSSDEINFSSVAGSGIPDLKEYMKLLKKKGSSAISGSALGMFQGMGPEFIDMMIASPLKVLPQFMVGKMISKNAEKMIDDFNQTIGGLFGTTMMKLNDYADRGNNEFLRKIAGALGIRTSLKTSLSTSNYEKGTMRWNGKANKALTEVIPTYLAKIEALLSGKSAKIYDYEAGAFVNAEDIKNNFDRRMKDRANSASFDMKSRFRDEISHQQFDTVAEREQLQKDMDQFFLHIFKNGKFFNPNDKAASASKFGVSSKENFEKLKNMFANSPIGMRFMFNQNILRERDNYNRMMRDLEAQGSDLSLMLYNNSGIAEEDTLAKLNEDIAKYESYRSSLKAGHKDLKLIDQELDKLREKVRMANASKGGTGVAKSSNNIFTTSTDHKGHNIFWYLENILVTMKNGGLYSEGGSGYTVPYDESYRGQVQYERRKRTEENANLQQRNYRNSHSKYSYKYINSADVANASKYEEYLRVRKEKDLLEEQLTSGEMIYDADGNLRATTFRERLDKASGLSKLGVISDALVSVVQRPVDAMARMMNIADKKLAQLMYGGPIKTDEGKEVNGILGLISYHIKDTFIGLKDWFGDMFGGVFKGNGGKFDIRKIKIFGKGIDDLKNGFGGFFREFGSSMNEIFKKSIDSIKNVGEDVSVRFFGNGRKITNLDSIKIDGKSIKDYLGVEQVSDDDLDKLLKTSGIFSAEDTKAVDRYLGNKKRTKSAIIEKFTKAARSMGLSPEETEGFIAAISRELGIMSIDQLGDGTRAAIKNLNNSKIFSMDRMFGESVQGSDGKWRYVKNSDTMAMDNGAYNKLVSVMDSLGFNKEMGDDYNIAKFLQLQADEGSSTTELLQTIERQYKFNEDQAKVEATHRNTIVTHQKYVASGMDRIIYYLSKIAGEKTPDAIQRRIVRENENEVSVDDYIRNRNIAAINKVHEIAARREADIEQHASGARYITRSGITAISKGELIIPSDQNPFNPNRNNVNRSAELAKERSIIREFNKGKTPYMNANADGITQEESNEATVQYIPQADNQGEPTTGGAIGKGITRAAEILSTNLSKAIDSLTGRNADSASSNRLKEAIDDAIKHSGRTGARMLAGSIAGSFSFGALALNPLIGASIGSGIALINSSDKFKNWFFGVEENGEFKKGILPASVTNWIQKKGKDFGMSALGGGVLGLLTNHPLIGLILGSGVGLAKTSDKFREAMFGEAGVFDKEKQEKITKGIKSAALGAAGMKLLAPKLMPTATSGLGIISQLLIGGAVGFLAQSEKVQEMIFGRKDDATGKYEHGLLPTLRHIVVDPLGRLVNGIEERALFFLKDNIARPLKTFFEPLGRLKKKSGEIIKDLFGRMTDKIGGDISRGFSNAFRPMWDAIKNSAVGKIFKGAFKTIQTITNPLKWMQLAGKGMGNLFGKMGLMNHLTTEEYNNRYGFFGKAAAKRKGSNTIEAIENADLSSEQYKKILGDLKLINGSRGQTRDAEKKARLTLQNKLRDNFGENAAEFERARALATSNANFDIDENGNFKDENVKAELDQLTLSAYRQRFVGRNRTEARLNAESANKTLYAMISNNNNNDKASIAMNIIKNSTNMDDALAKMNEYGIKIPARSVQAFKKQFDNYKTYSGQAQGMTNKTWNAMSDEEKLDMMRKDTNFDEQAVAKGIANAAKEYQSAGLAVENADALKGRLDTDIRALGINPDKLSTAQLEEILRGQYKNKQLTGFFDNENYDPVTAEEENLEAVNNINDTVETKTTQMIDLLERIAGRLGDEEAKEALMERKRYIQDEINAGSSPMEAVMATNDAMGETDDLTNSVQHHMAGGMKPNGDIDRATTKPQEVEEASKAAALTEYIQNRNNDAVEKAKLAAMRRGDLPGTVPENPLADTIRAAAERQNQEQETKEGLFSRVKNRARDILNTPIRNPFKRKDGTEGDDVDTEETGPRFGNFFRRPVAVNANGGVADRDTLSAVSAGELIIDKSDEGYNNRLSNNKIWSFANGNIPPEQKKQVEEAEKREEKKDAQQDEMSKNMRLMRETLASDKDIRANRGKAPSFLTKVGGALKNVFNPKKLFRKAGMLAIGAGILLSPLLDKLLGAVVPFITDTLIPKISEALPGILDKIMKLVPSLLNLIVEVLPKFVNTLVSQTLPEVLKLLPSLITGAGDIIASLATSIPKILKPILDMLPAAIKSVFTEIIPAIWDILPEFINMLSNSIGDIVGSLAESLVSVIGSIIKNLPSILVNVVKGLGKASFSLVKGLFGGAGGTRKKTKLEQKIDTRMELPTKAISNMAAAGRGKPKSKGRKGKGPSIFSYAGSGITSFFRNLFKKKDNKPEDEDDSNESAIETYTNGMSYLNGKQVNPILAHISQNSEKYKNRPFNIPMVDKGITLGSDGCGIMSGAMVINGLTGAETVTPEKMAAHAILTGNKAPGGGIKAKYFGEIFKKYGIDANYHDMTNEETKATTKKNIINALKANKPVILMGNDTSGTGKTPFPSNNHYVVATGISEDGSKVILNDPYESVGGDVYNIDDVLDKTIVGIEASKNNAGLTSQSVDFTKKVETSNMYGKVTNTTATLRVNPIATNIATTNLGKQFDPIAYQDLGNYNPMTVDEMNNFINYWAQLNGHDAFVGHGDVFIKAAEETGLDPRYILAHAATESAWGTSKLAREKGNYFGITAYNGDEYNSATNFGKGLDSIISGAKWIKKNFYENGQKSLYDMIYAKPNHRYAVYDDGSPNDYWVSTIASIMRKGPNAYTNAGDNSGSGAPTPISIRGNYYNNTLSNPYAELLEYMTVNSGSDRLKGVQFLYGQELPNFDPGAVMSGNMEEDDNGVPTFYGTLRKVLNKVYEQYWFDQYLQKAKGYQSINEITDEDRRTLDENLVPGSVNPILTDIGSSLLHLSGDQYATAPYIWDKINFDELMISRTGKNGKEIAPAMIKDIEEYKDLPIDTLLREILYNPRLIGLSRGNDPYKAEFVDSFVNDIAMYHQLRTAGKRDVEAEAEIAHRLNELVDNIIAHGIQLTPEQTAQLYRSPTAFRNKDIIKYSPYGSELLLPKGASPFTQYENVLHPDMKTLGDLHVQDRKLKEFIESGGTFSNTAEFIRLANQFDNVGLSEEEKEAHNKKVDDLANAAEKQQEDISTIYEEDQEARESGVVQQEGKQGLLDAMRNISSYFSQVFDIIADMIWGGGWSRTGKQGTTNLGAMRNNEFNTAPENSNKSIITTGYRPDTFAKGTDAENSEIIKAFTKMNTPNGGRYWQLPVYGRFKNTDKYLLADGYTIEIPRSKILSGYEDAVILETSTAVATSAQASTSTTISVAKRPDNYGDATKSEILRAFLNRSTPDNYGGSGVSWNLKVTGRNKDGNYLLEDGTTVKIPDTDIKSKSSILDSIPSFGFTQDGSNINDLIGDGTNAADDFFLNSFRNNGAPYASKTSTGPAYDTMGGTRLHSGIDYGTGGQNPGIFSPISGTVTRNTPGTGTGNYLVIKEDGKTDGKQRYHRFMHMNNSTPMFDVGDKVKQGDLIGYVGNTGYSSGAHLHYDIADETGLGGSAGKGADYLEEHFAEPNAYLRQYFSNQGYTGNKIYNQSTSSSSSNNGSEKGGEMIDLKNIYEVILTVVEYLAKISDNTGLIGEIVTLLTKLDKINSDKTLTDKEKAEETTKVRKTIADKAREYSMMLNSSNNETTGHNAMVKAMQHIAGM